MKKLKHLYLPVAAVLFSAAALYLRRQLYAVALDEKGLLLTGHPLETALWAVVLGGALLFILAASRLGGSNLYEDNFHPSLLAFCSNAFLSATVMVMALNQVLPLSEKVNLAWRILGFVTHRDCSGYPSAALWAGSPSSVSTEPCPSSCCCI